MRRVCLAVLVMVGMMIGICPVLGDTYGMGSVALPKALEPSNFSVGAGYSYLYMDSGYGSSSVPKGWWAEFCYKFDLAGSGEKDFTAFVELGGHYKGKVTYSTYLAGLRYSFAELWKNFIPYVQGEIGFGNFNANHSNKFLYGVGVGGLIPINKHLYLKPLQFDILHQTGYNGMIDLKVTSGVVVNF